MSEEDESFQQSSQRNNKILTSENDISFTDSTSIQNPDADSDKNNQIVKDLKSTFFTDPSYPLISNQADDNIEHDSPEEASTKKKQIENSETDLKSDQRSIQSNNSNGSLSSRRSKNASNTNSYSQNRSSKQSSTFTTNLFSTSDSTSSTMTSTISKKSTKNSQNSQEDKISNASQLLLEKGTLPPYEIQGKVLQYLKSLSLQALEDCDYPRAAQIDKGINKIVKETYRRCSGNRELRRERKVDHKFQKANYLLKKEEEECQAIYDEFLREEDEKFEKMKERHSRELSMLEEEWNKPETLIPFNKSSQQLLSLRRSQKVLALSKRYEEAEELKKHADSLQRKELREAKEKARLAYNQAYQTIVDQHNKEIQCFFEHKQRLASFLDLERKKAIRPFQNMAAFYQRQQSARSLPNGKPAPKVNNSYSGRSLAKRATSLFEALPPTRPDIVEGVTKYKARPETHPLGLTSIMPKNRKNRPRPKSVASNRETKEGADPSKL